MHKVQPFENQESPGYSNRIYPDDDKPINVAKPAKNPMFQISQDSLIEIIMDSQNRKFSEEVDKLEKTGGGFFQILFNFPCFL